jgi:hypothetical protein
MVDQITFINKDVDRIIEEMIAKKNQLCPELNDDNIASVNRTLLETVSIQLGWMIQQLNVIGNQNYVKTASDYEAIMRLMDLVAYQVPTATPARTTLTITFRSNVLNSTIIYPKWTQFATLGTSTEERIIYEAEEEIIKGPGVLTVDVPIVQGERTSGELIDVVHGVSARGSSDGSGFQEFILENYPVIIDDSLEIWVVNSLITPPTIEMWTRVESLLPYDSDDTVYEISYDENTQVTIKFGNGTWGMIPSIGTNNIIANYRTGGGVIGNVAADKILVMVASDSAFESCTNTLAATGGQDKATLNEIRLKGPNSIKYSDRVVATEDFGIRAMEYPGVARATQFEREHGENTVGVHIVPVGGGVATLALETEVENYILQYSTTTLDVFCSSARYQTIEITATIYITNDADEIEIDTAIKAAVDQYYDATYINSDGEFNVDFGEKITRAKLFYLIMGAHEDIINVTLTKPAADVETNQYLLPEILVNSPSLFTMTYIRWTE